MLEENGEASEAGPVWPHKAVVGSVGATLGRRVFQTSLLPVAWLPVAWLPVAWPRKAVPSSAASAHMLVVGAAVSLLCRKA